MATSSPTKANALRRRKMSTRSGAKSATASLLKAADEMHAELLAQVAALMNSRVGSKRNADLSRIARVVEHYEDKRWPIL